MTEDFLSHSDSLRDDRSDSSPIPPSGYSGDSSDHPANPPARLRMLLMGDLEGVRGMIHRFHAEGIAAVSDWSRIIPVPNSTEVMSILILRP